MTKAKLKEPEGDLLSQVDPAPKPEARKPAPKAKKPATEVATVTRLPVVQKPRSLIEVIADAASNPNVDVAKMKELLAMQREIEQVGQARLFNEAMIAAKEEMPAIVRDRENPHTRSRYATLEKVSKEIDKVARKHGFGMSFGMDESTILNHHRIICDLMHTGGHVRHYHVDLPSDSVGAKGTSNKTPVQGIGSTISYARRYLKLMMFDLHIIGEDNDGNAVGKSPDAPAETVITSEQIKLLSSAIDFCGVGLPRFLENYKIKELSELPATMFNEAKKACQDYLARVEARKKEMKDHG